MTRIEQLSRLGHTTATRVLDAFNADQPRDEHGRWGEGGTQASTSGQHGELSSEHQSFAREAHRLGRPDEAKAHQEAAFQHAVARNSPTPEHTARAQEASKIASDLSKKMHAERTAEHEAKMNGPVQGATWRDGLKERVASAPNSSRSVAEARLGRGGGPPSMTKPKREAHVSQVDAWRASRTSGAAAARLRSFKGKKMG
jgi:hypothetical protein